MTFDQARPILENWLREYGLYRRRPPAPAISMVYDQAAVPPPRPLPPHSSVEQYVVRHERELRIEKALNELRGPEHDAIILRYVERARIGQVARRLHTSRATAYRIIERGLCALAALMGLLREDVTEETVAKM